MTDDKNDIAIRVQNVSKTFKLPHEKHTTLKSTFLNSFRRKEYEMQHALKDVGFEVKKGEFFGIVGRNGSGKSTLLKCVAGVYTPDAGKIHVNGSLVPFIELGVGFNPELSGRDNVFLNGALLGFNRSEMANMYDEIVEFAELERFMDQKLKNYSSGMQVRLAFSIAIRAQGDILLLDEVLAVGDAAFQKKCFDHFARLKRMKRTVVIVTHDMSAIERYCNRAILIEAGTVKKLGAPQEIAYVYTKENTYVSSAKEQKKQDEQNEALHSKRGISIDLTNTKNVVSNVFNYGDEARLKIKWQNPAIKNIGVAILKNTGEYIFGANTILDKIVIKGRSIEYRLKLTLGDGGYLFKIGFFGNDDTEKIDFVDNGPAVYIRSVEKQKWGGTVKLDHKWSKNV